jgi:hypothetical protein
MSATALFSPADGIKAYTRLGLRLYDLLIVGILARYVWECPAEAFVGQYRKYVSSNHADVGVGTGYCLDRCGFDAPDPRLALIDLQINCLEFTARRLARYRPQVFLHDASRPLLGVRPFDSVALGGILHCLPGDMRQKGAVFDALASICNDGATIFGFTLVNDAIPHRARRRLAYGLLNRLRVVNCLDDSADELRRALAVRFAHYSVDLTGCFAFFSAVAAHERSRTRHSHSGRSLS